MLDPERARELGRLGGRARRRPLTLERVETELGNLDSIEDAQRWLRRIALWAAAGMLHGAVASACNRSVEVWLRGHEAKLTREITEHLRARVEELEGQLRAPKGGGGR